MVHCVVTYPKFKCLLVNDFRIGYNVPGHNKASVSQ